MSVGQMTIGQSLLPEFDSEMSNTRKILERLPDDKLDWRVHEKSNTIGWVANHVAEIPGWVEGTLKADHLDMNPPGGPKFETPSAGSRAEILAMFDANVASGRAALEQAEDKTFSEPWSLLDAGVEIFTLPRSVVLRTFVFSHLIHHRAHLCVYYRINNIPVPGMYGPSADEQ